MELMGIDKEVMEILEKYMSSKLCANSVGQVKKILYKLPRGLSLIEISYPLL